MKKCDIGRNIFLIAFDKHLIIKFINVISLTRFFIFLLIMAKGYSEGYKYSWSKRRKNKVCKAT